MLGLAERLRCCFFQASTSEAYRDPSIHPQAEDYWGNVNPVGPRSYYDEGEALDGDAVLQLSPIVLIARERHKSTSDRVLLDFEGRSFEAALDRVQSS